MDRNNYNTKQRDEIVEFFSRHRGKCFSAKDIIRSGEIKSGEATVYRTLSKLAENGVLKRFTDGSSGACYQLAESSDCDKHFHLKCEKCGKLIHLSCDFMNGVCDHILSHHSFRVDNAKTTLLGLCEDCYKEEKADGGH